jgi:acetyl esterase/lipase
MTNFTKHTHTYKQGKGYAIDLDVYMPENAESGLAAVMYIHGGALIWGSREHVHETEINTVLGGAPVRR